MHASLALSLEGEEGAGGAFGVQSAETTGGTTDLAASDAGCPADGTAEAGGTAEAEDVTVAAPDSTEGCSLVLVGTEGRIMPPCRESWPIPPPYICLQREVGVTGERANADCGVIRGTVASAHCRD